MGPVHESQLSTVRSHSENAAGGMVCAPFPVDPQAYDYYCFSNS
jgi:hypothetical protein